MEKSLSGLRSDNIQLESQTTATKETQVVNVYSPQEIQKIDTDVRSLEQKNRRLREILAQIGVSTVNVTTGNVKTQEMRDVEHFSNLRRVSLN